MGSLDTRQYTSHHTPTDTVARVGPACVKLALNCCSYLQSTVRLSLQSDRTYNPHPCTVLTAAHNIHTRPPDAPARLPYQRTLMNPYCMFDLCRPRWTRHLQGNQGRCTFLVTRNGAGIDLPGFERDRTDMSDQEDTPAAQTARGGSRSHGGHALAREDDHGHPWSRGDFVPADDPGWS